MKININRLTYATAGIEITRKCNLNCAHCLRGDSQNMDMPFEVIDDFLDHTQAIYHLVFTGGEPTLNLDGLRYFLDSAKRHNVFISSMEMTTNGTVQNQDLVDIIRDYNNYICQFVYPEYRGSFPITIQISRDDFHDTDYEKAYQWYNDNLSDYAQIRYNNNGRFVLKSGRANSIKYAFNQDDTLKKIQIKTTDNNPLCTQKNLIPVFHKNQVVVLCSLWVTANGYLHSRMYATWEDEDNNPDDIICHVRVNSAQDIVDAIEKYNAKKPFCIQRKDNPKPGILNSYSELMKQIETSYSSVKYNADKEYKENFVRQLARTNRPGTTMKRSIQLALIASYLDVDVMPIVREINDEYYSAQSDTDRLNVAVLNQVKKKIPSNEEIIEISELAYDIYNRELFGNHWDRMKQFQFDSDYQKFKHSRILSDIDFANDMLSLKPDSDYYKDRLAESTKELEDFEADLLLISY